MHLGDHDNIIVNHLFKTYVCKGEFYSVINSCNVNFLWSTRKITNVIYECFKNSIY